MANFFDQFDQPAASGGGNFFDQFDTLEAGPVASRFGDFHAPSNAAALRSALGERAEAMTRGPTQSGLGQLATDFSNVLPAAEQRTSPNISAYRGRLVSPRTTVDETGGVLYLDQQTGQFRPTDSATQVALRDPADNQLKVYERSAETAESPAVGVARVLAPGLAAGAPTARAAIPAASKAAQRPAASDIFATAKPHYREFVREASQVEIPPETAVAFADRIKRSLGNANLIPELAQPVYSAVGILEKGEPLTLDALQNIKRTVQRGFKSPDANVRDAAAVASKEIVKIISEVSPSAGRAYKTADEIQSAAYGLRDLQRKEAVAGLRTGRAGYGGNAVNSMRQVLSPIVQKSIEGRTTGFKPHEIAAMKDIVEGTAATNALRLVGQLSPSKGVFQTAGAGAAGYALGPAALAVPVAGAAANKLATILTGKQIGRLKELVAKRSPAYEQAVERAINRFEKAQVDFVNDPKPNRLAAYVSASRALSAGLTRDGIEVTSGDLLRTIQGPMRGAAEDEQPEPERVLD